VSIKKPKKRATSLERRSWKMALRWEGRETVDSSARGKYRFSKH